MAERQPHAVLDLKSRRKKALKIERLLNLSSRKQPVKLLEIGTGSGGIAHYFATHSSLQFDVTAVDVCDQRQVREGYEFHLVHDTVLPFANNSFDIVLSNHVIEHVGNSVAQYHHLREIMRVMKDDGLGYLAVPNRWMLVEPHYRLIFLSWLPTSMRSLYVRLLRRGKMYDCRPLSLKELEHFLAKAGFIYKNISTRALKETLDIESPQGIAATVAGKLPDRFLDRLKSINPTLIYRLKL